MREAPQLCFLGNWLSPNNNKHFTTLHSSHNNTNRQKKINKQKTGNQNKPKQKKKQNKKLYTNFNSSSLSRRPSLPMEMLTYLTLLEGCSFKEDSKLRRVSIIFLIISNLDTSRKHFSNLDTSRKHFSNLDTFNKPPLKKGVRRGLTLSRASQNKPPFFFSGKGGVVTFLIFDTSNNKHHLYITPFSLTSFQLAEAAMCAQVMASDVNYHVLLEDTR